MTMKTMKSLLALMALLALGLGSAVAEEKEEAKNAVTYEVTMTGVT